MSSPNKPLASFARKRHIYPTRHALGFRHLCGQSPGLLCVREQANQGVRERKLLQHPPYIKTAALRAAIDSVSVGAPMLRQVKALRLLFPACSALACARNDFKSGFRGSRYLLKELQRATALYACFPADNADVISFDFD